MENLLVFEKLENAKVVTDYVGRGMGGVETTALVTESREDVIFELLEIIEREAYTRSEQSYKFHDAIEAIKEVITSSVDSMGKDKVVLY